MWGRPLALLIGLYVWVTYRYDLHHLTQGDGPLAGLGLVEQLPPFLMVAVTAMVLLDWPAVVQAAAPVRLGFPPPTGVRPYLVFVAAAAVFLPLTRLLFSPFSELTVEVWMLLGWCVVVLGVVSAALNLAIPFAGQSHLVRALARPLGLGLLVGAFAWGVSQLAGELWEGMAGVTLYCVYGLLTFLGQNVQQVPGTDIIGLPNFFVEVAPECSGYEGVGLIAAFLGAYVWRYRGDLRFPHALALPVVGVVLVWLFNNVRIAGLILIGEYVSESVAVGGFHAKAGWLFFCATAIGLVAVAQRIPWLRRNGREPVGEVERPAAPYLVPLIVLLSVSLVTGMVTVGFEHLYPVRVVAAGIAAAYAWKIVRPESYRPDVLAIIAGLAVLLMWLALVPRDPELDAIRAATLDELHPAWLYTWVAFRCLGASLVVPVVEELAFRGFLLRRVESDDFESVRYQDCKWWALGVSSIAFGLLHSESWIAGSLAGAAYGFVVMRTGRLYDAVFAHGLTNAALAVYVLAGGHYHLW